MSNYDTAKTAFYQALKGINVKKNEKIVLECKSFWSYEFAKDIPGADIKAHEIEILELKNPHYSFYFVRDIPGANIEEHFKVIYNFKDKYWLNRFIKEVNYKGTKVEEWLMYI